MEIPLNTLHATVFDAIEITRRTPAACVAFSRVTRRWLIALSVLLASWQVVAGVRATDALSHPCCETLCDQAMPCAFAGCMGCADRALEAPGATAWLLSSMEAPPSAEHLVALQVRADDIWKPPR